MKIGVIVYCNITLSIWYCGNVHFNGVRYICLNALYLPSYYYALLVDIKNLDNLKLVKMVVMIIKLIAK